MKPMPGHAIMEIESEFKVQEGSIFIPQKSRKIKGRIGRIVSWTPYPSQPYQMWMMQNGKTERVTVEHPERYNKDFEGIVGKRFLADTYRLMEVEDQLLAIVRLEHLVMSLPENVNTDVAQSGPTRCTRCKSKGELNIMLDAEGYCPMCHKDKHGEFKPGHFTPDKYGLATDRSVNEQEIQALAPW